MAIFLSDSVTQSLQPPPPSPDPDPTPQLGNAFDDGGDTGQLRDGYVPPTGDNAPAWTPPPTDPNASYNEGYSPAQAPAASAVGGSPSSYFPYGWNGPANPTAAQNADLQSAGAQAGVLPNGQMDIQRLPVGAAGLGGGSAAELLGGLAGSTIAQRGIAAVDQKLPPWLRAPLEVAGSVAGFAAGGRGLSNVSDSLGDAPASYVDPSRQGDMAASIVPGVGPAPAGMTRLYRGEGSSLGADTADATQSRYFTTDPQQAVNYAKLNRDNVHYIDVPTATLNSATAAGPEALDPNWTAPEGFHRMGTTDFLVPSDVAKAAQDAPNPAFPKAPTDAVAPGSTALPEAQPAGAAQPVGAQAPLEAHLASLSDADLQTTAAAAKSAPDITPDVNQAIAAELGRRMGMGNTTDVLSTQNADRAAQSAQAKMSADLTDSNLTGRVPGTEPADAAEGAAPFPPAAPANGAFNLPGPDEVAAGNAMALDNARQPTLQNPSSNVVNTHVPADNNLGGGGGEPPTAEAVPPLGDPRTPAVVQQATSSLRELLNPLNLTSSGPYARLNQVARSIQTVGDIASFGRLAFTLGVNRPLTYLQGWGEAINALRPMDVQAAVDHVQQRIIQGGVLGRIGIGGAADLYGRDSAAGMHGMETDPLTGEVGIGKGQGLLSGVSRESVIGRIANSSTRLLSTFKQTAGPQILSDMVDAKMKSGEFPADFSVAQPAAPEGVSQADWATSPEMEQWRENVSKLQDLGKSVDLALGHTSWLGANGPSAQGASLFVNFGNWTAAQAETIANAVSGTVKTAASLVPGVDSPLSASETESRNTVAKLVVMATTATAAINAANGVSPLDPRANRNGIPMVVITPKMAAALHAYGNWANQHHIPVVAGALDFKDNTQESLYGPLGTMVSAAAGAARAGYEGATGGSRFGGTAPTTTDQRIGGAVKGAGGEALYYGRGLESYSARIINDLMQGKTITGQKPSLQNEIPTPLNANNLVSERPVSTGLALQHTLGLRGYEPSAYEALNNAITAKYGAYNDTTVAQARQDSSFDKLFADSQQVTASKGGPAGDYIKTQAAENATLADIGKQLTAGTITTKAALAAYHDSTTRMQGAYNALHINDTPQQKANPTDPLGKYYAAKDAATTDGITDWNAVDAYRAAQSPADQQTIDSGTGKASSLPWVQNIKTTQAQLQKTGFYDLGAKAWADIRNDPRAVAAGLPDTFAQYQQTEESQLQAEMLAKGVPATQAPLEAAKAFAAYGTVKAYDTQMRTQYRHQWVVDNRALAQQATAAGYFTPDAEEEKFLRSTP